MNILCLCPFGNSLAMEIQAHGFHVSANLPGYQMGGELRSFLDCHFKSYGTKLRIHMFLHVF
jgi:hypothetical protein